MESRQSVANKSALAWAALPAAAFAIAVTVAFIKGGDATSNNVDRTIFEGNTPLCSQPDATVPQVGRVAMLAPTSDCKS